MLRASQPCLRALRSTAPFARLPAPRAQRRHYASVTELTSYPKPGERIHGFTLQRAKHVSELELTALLLQHDKTGAEYLHVARDDSNNVFSIGFKTNPPDDTGVPHILEHTTLCGSERYPIRDPFFKMLPRSLSNFMNAFTSSDHTSYPFATTNRQDFKNLLSVYMDATLHPLLKASDFTQEGWRIGPENPAAALGESSLPEADSKLVFKGVVYNEMKGQMSDASYLFWIRYHDHLIPALNNSGGDPQRITDLTHEQLKKYHADHYHPSNAKIFTYGDMPLLDHLKELGPRLEKFDRIRVDHDIKSPIGFQDGPTHVTVKGPEDPLVPSDAQYKTSTTWLTGDTINIVERFSLSVLSSLLLDGYGSPLYRDLIEAGLGTDFTPNTGFSPTGKQAVFSVGLSGVKQDDVPKVKEALQKSLRETKEKGFEKIKVDGILHQLELSLKHKTSNFGMSIMQRLKPDWFNGVDPFDALAWQKTVDAFKERYAREGYLEGLLEKYLLNDRTLTFTMEPSEAYAQELAAEEAERLAKKIKDETKGFASDEEAHKHLAQREMELLKVQEEARDQDLSCLPSVHVKDIPRQKEKKPVRDTKVGGVQVQWRETPTNGLTYFRLLIPQTMQMSNNSRQHTPLLCDALLRLGTRRHSMEQLEELIKLKTGGINVAYFSSASPLNLKSLEEGISIAGSALDENVPAMLDLVREIILETDFDSPDTEKKIRELLQTSASNSMDAVAESGHAYAKRFVESGLSPAGLAREQTAGLTQVKLIAGLASRGPTESLEDVIQALKEIQSRALSKSKMRIAINCGSESASKTEQALQNFLSSLPSTDNATITTNASQSFYPRTIKSFFPLPYQVYYSAVAFPTVPYIDPSGAPLQILAQLLTHNHLHHEIREKGGAYGAGAYSQGLEGIFGAYAYRDPNPLQTLKTISEAGAEARDRKWKDRQIEEAKLSVFQALDAPESVSQEGMHRFLSGVDDKMLQKRREQLLDVTAEDVKRVAEEYLVQGAKRSNIAVLGAKQDWVDQQSGWEIEDVGVAAQVLQGDSEE